MSRMAVGERIKTTRGIVADDPYDRDLPKGTQGRILEVVKPEPYAVCATDEGVRFHVYAYQFENTEKPS